MENQISRKDFFKTFLGGFKAAVADDPRRQSRLLDYQLPPGSSRLPKFLEECTQCYQCISVCPHEALRVWRKDDSQLNGFPVIIPREEPCLQCPERPCIAACESGALAEEKISNNRYSAQILPEKCLAWQDNFCQACINNCPHSGKAIYLNAQARPEINPELCDGCAACIHVCPAEKCAIALKLENSEEGEN